MSNLRIVLSPPEMMQAALVGVMRNVQDLKLNRKPAYGLQTGREWQINIEGCLGEFAFCKHMGLFWSGAHHFRAEDAHGWQIRTASRPDSRLIVHREDCDTHRFVLLTGCNGMYEVRGWLSGAEAKQHAYWCDPAGNRPAYFVPQSVLHKFGEQEQAA